MEGESKRLVLEENRDAMELVPSWEVEWWWYAVGVAVLILLILLILLVVMLMGRKVAVDVGKQKRDAYKRALGRLAEMRDDMGKGVAVGVSVELRRYLAESLGEPALFETQEEFVSRHDALAGFSEELKGDVGRYFGELAAVKYGPVESGGEVAGDMVARGISLLERMYAA
jgi:hypothetical protein